MIFLEEQVRFESDGVSLFGIYHPAKDGHTEYGIVFPNSGMQNRVGPHRLYVKFARQLAKEGFCVLRMDFPGIGESGGKVEETHFDCHKPIHTVHALDFLFREKKVKHVAVFGLCAGARNAIKVAATDERVERTAMWSLPIIWMPPNFPGPKEDPRGYMSRKGAKLALRDKLKKSMRITAWKKYLSSGGNCASMLQYIRSILWNLVGDEKKWSNVRHGDFLTAFTNVVRTGKKALFLYGENDEILIQEFKEKLNQYAGGRYHGYDFMVIPGGNHSFTSIETEVDARERTLNWFKEWKLTKKNKLR